MSLVIDNNKNHSFTIILLSFKDSYKCEFWSLTRMHIRSVKHQQTDRPSTNGPYCMSWEMRWIPKAGEPLGFYSFFVQAWDLLKFPINMDICLKLEWVWLQKAMQACYDHLNVSPKKWGGNPKLESHWVSTLFSGLGPSLISNQHGHLSQIGMSMVAEGNASLLWSP